MTANKLSSRTPRDAEIVGEQFMHELLRGTISTFRSEAEMARAVGVSRSHFNRVVRGEKPIQGKVLKWLGYREVRGYKEIK